jgi:hypothetical protein
MQRSALLFRTSQLTRRFLVLTFQFKGKVKSQSFYPGKGMRDHETFEELVAASNPALQTVRRDAWCSHWLTLVCLLIHPNASLRPVFAAVQGQGEEPVFLPREGHEGPRKLRRSCRSIEPGSPNGTFTRCYPAGASPSKLTASLHFAVQGQDEGTELLPRQGHEGPRDLRAARGGLQSCT